MKLTVRTSASHLAIAASLVTASGCGGDGTTGSALPDTKGSSSPAGVVRGAVLGLRGAGLTLRLNEGEELPITADGPFAFTTKLAKDAAYQVAVAAQPKAPAQVCTVHHGAGTVGTTDVMDVLVTCVDGMFPVEVQVTGLASGTSLVLQNDRGDDLTVTMPGKVAFPTPLKEGQPYAVTVKAQPSAPMQICVVKDGTGTIAAAPARVTVECTGWAHRREIAIVSDRAKAATSEQVMVVLPPSFSYGKAKPNGEDLRFAPTASFATSLPYFIESWTPGGTSVVWVKVPSVPVGASTIQMFYGQTSAAPASDFATTFPDVWISPGDGKSRFVAEATIDVDWFELKAPDAISASGARLTVNARRIIVAGTIARSGGDGPSYAGAAPIGDGGGGGGGYGGKGGDGAHDDGMPPGPGGNVYGSADDHSIGVGSAGGGASGYWGGPGGGMLWLAGTFVSIPGKVVLDGVQTVAPFALSGPGGGSGGGLLVDGVRVDCRDGTISAKGAPGSAGQTPAENAGGGGGGGRLEFFARSDYFPPLIASVAGGAAGPFGMGVPAQDGEPGTVFATSSASAADVPAVRASIGPEK